MDRDDEIYLDHVMDQQLCDRAGRRMGKVDGLVLALAEGEAPRVTHIAVGGDTLGRRLRGPVGRLVTWAARRWGARRGAPYLIPWSAVRKVDIDVEVDVDAEGTPALHWEDRLRERIVSRVPWT